MLTSCSTIIDKSTGIFVSGSDVKPQCNLWLGMVLWLNKFFWLPLRFMNEGGRSLKASLDVSTRLDPLTCKGDDVGSIIGGDADSIDHRQGWHNGMLNSDSPPILSDKVVSSHKVLLSHKVQVMLCC